MSLDKAIASGDEHRRPYRKSKRVDSCGWCKGNRTVKTRRQIVRAQEIERDWREEYGI